MVSLQRISALNIAENKQALRDGTTTVQKILGERANNLSVLESLVLSDMLFTIMNEKYTDSRGVEQGTGFKLYGTQLAIIALFLQGISARS